MSERRKASNGGLITVEVPRPTVTMVSEKFPQGAVFLLCPPEALQPEFIRLPEGGEDQKCPVTGLSRSKLVDLLKDAGDRVNVRSLRKRGSTRGVTLIDRKSLIDYINSQPRPDWCSASREEESSEG